MHIEHILQQTLLPWLQLTSLHSATDLGSEMAQNLILVFRINFSVLETDRVHDKRTNRLQENGLYPKFRPFDVQDANMSKGKMQR